MSPAQLWPRMLRAARLDPQFYEEVEADANSIGQALLVVVLVSLARGIGDGITAVMKGGPEGLVLFVSGLAWGVIGYLIIWFIFSLLCFWLGTSLFKGPQTKTNLGELLRTLGFAFSPGVLNVLSFIPVVGQAIPFATFIWALIASVIATRQACDFTTGKAVGTVVVAAIVPLIIMILLAMLITGSFIAASK